MGATSDALAVEAVGGATDTMSEAVALGTEVRDVVGLLGALWRLDRRLEQAIGVMQRMGADQDAYRQR